MVLLCLFLTCITSCIISSSNIEKPELTNNNKRYFKLTADLIKLNNDGKMVDIKKLKLQLKNKKCNIKLPHQPTNLHREEEGCCYCRSVI